MLCGNADAAAKLQYLHVTNGGMMAFYDDGNAKCARAANRWCRISNQ